MGDTDNIQGACGDRLCVICSSSCNTFSSSSRQCLSTHRYFSRFCGELELCSSVDGEETENYSQRFVASHFLQTLDRSADKFSVCSECIVLITSAMEQKATVEEAEYEVLKLQIELLTKLKMLKKCTESYLMEMMKIFEKTKDLDEVLEIEEDITGMKTYRKGKWKKYRSRCNVLLFREKIMDGSMMVTNMALFRDDVAQKLIDQPPRDISSSSKPTFKNDVGDGVNINTPLIVPDLVSSSPVSSPALEDDYRNDHDDDYDLTGCQKGDPSPFHSADENNEKNDLGGTAEVKEEIDDVNDEDADHIELHQQENVVSDDDDDDYIPTKKSKVTRGRPKKIPPKEAKPNQRKNAQNKSTVSCKKDKTPVKSKSSSSERKVLQKRKLSQLDVKNMTNLKACMVERILRRPPCDLIYEEIEIEGGGRKQIIKNLGKMDYKDAWDYDPTTDKLTLVGLEIGLEESSDPPTLTLSCHPCSFRESADCPTDPKATKQIILERINSLQNKLFNHVFSHHLNAFGCPHCNHLSVTLRTYKHHLIIHRDPNRARCGHCGKEFQHYHSIYRHKRIYPACRGELPVEGESAENPHQEKKYQCVTCGRSFAQFVCLQDHEETHLELEVRSKVTCPRCGAHMLRRSFRDHKRIYCPALKKEKPVCHLCGKQFSSLRYVKAHTIRKHKGEATMTV